jgi:hypothetical protein
MATARVPIPAKTPEAPIPVTAPRSSRKAQQEAKEGRHSDLRRRSHHRPYLCRVEALTVVIRRSRVARG